jgi:hypothetical protein
MSPALNLVFIRISRSAFPVEEDHAALAEILTGSKQSNLKFKVETSTTLASALAVFRWRCRWRSVTL